MNCNLKLGGHCVHTYPMQIVLLMIDNDLVLLVNLSILENPGTIPDFKNCQTIGFNDPTMIMYQ